MILGIVYKDGKIINHRSLLKIIFNPILRYFGWCIGSLFDENNNFIRLTIFKCTPNNKIFWEKYDCDYDYLIKKRRII